jgi:hypothetical protein
VPTSESERMALDLSDPDRPFRYSSLHRLPL